MEKTDELIKKVVCDRDGDAFMEMLCLPNKELKNVMNRMKEIANGTTQVQKASEEVIGKARLD